MCAMVLALASGLLFALSFYLNTAQLGITIESNIRNYCDRSPIFVHANNITLPSTISSQTITFDHR